MIGPDDIIVVLKSMADNLDQSATREEDKLDAIRIRNQEIGVRMAIMEIVEMKSSKKRVACLVAGGCLMTAGDICEIDCYGVRNRKI